MNDQEAKKKEYYSFFKEKFHMDFEKLSYEDANALLDDINHELDSMILNEQQKKEKLMKECHYNSDKLAELKEKYCNALLDEDLTNSSFE